MKIYFQTEFPFRSLSRKNHVFFQTEIPFQGDGIPYFRYDQYKYIIILKKQSIFQLIVQKNQ